MAHDKIHDLYTSCPNIRFYETKPGGFLGFGRKGYHYCSCTNQKIDDNYLSAVCNRNHWEQTGRLQGEGYFHKHFVDCNVFRSRGIVN